MKYSPPYCPPETCGHKDMEHCGLCCPCDICGEQRYWSEAHERLSRVRMQHAMVCEDY
jgi:hypothetical protein